MLADFDLIVEIKVKTEKSGATQLISVILSDTNLPVSVNPPSPLLQLNFISTYCDSFVKVSTP